MNAAIQIFLIALISGLLLLGSEIFVPGGVLGFFGGVALLIAVVSGFFAFPGYGVYVAVAILILVGVAIVLWIRLFPRSRVGRMMTVSKDLATSKSSQDGLPELLGKRGEAISGLRPSGFALIEGHRVDVVTEGGMLAKGEPIEVIRVEGNRVVVARVE